MLWYLPVVVVIVLFSGMALGLCLREVLKEKPSDARGVLAGAPPYKTLVLTAAVGGGHEAAGRTVRDELERAGHTVTMEDGLRTMSRALDWLLVRGYRRQVRSTPRTLGAVFAVTSRRTGAAVIRFLVGLLFARRLLRVLAKERPDLVISTYPLVTAALGRLRGRGRLRVPAVAIVADYGVHPLWVSPEIDRHLVVSRRSAELAERAGGRASVIQVPVAPAFRDAPTRDEARAVLGLPREAFVVLVVGGAWGIGDLKVATRCAAESGAYTIVVAGNNAGLEARLAAEYALRENVRVLGWRDDLPALMAAADCLIQNAGGMTCVEAIETGLPILMFDPILGHGEFNALVMEQAGAARWVRTEEALTGVLRSLARGEASLPAPRKEAAPTIPAFLESLPRDARRPAAADRRRYVRPRPVLLAGAAMLFSLLWFAFASPGVALAARELALRVPGHDPSPGEVSVGVRVTDPATAAELENLARKERVPVTVFVTSRGAAGLRPTAGLSFGVAEEPGESELSSWSERQKARTAAAVILRETGTRPRYFLAAPSTNLAALADAPPGTRLVMPEQAGEGEPRAGLLLLDTSGLSPGDARLRLVEVLRKIRDGGLTCMPLADL